jgi:dCTP deaminase
MAILADVDIRQALKVGELRVQPQLSDDQIGPGSIDVTLSNEFWKLKEGLKKGKPYDIKVITSDDLFEEIRTESIIISPGELVLAKILERITLAPDICGWIQGRSRFAQMGITAHVASSFIQPGSDNRQILEIVNLSHVPVTLHAGMRICQVIFERTMSKAQKPYQKIATKTLRQNK